MNDLLTSWDSIGRPRILVVGDIILDGYTWGDAERVSPEAPVLVLKVHKHEVRLGGAASVASLLRALDADVTLAGAIGDDANGCVVSRLLGESGIDSSLVVCDELRPTTSKVRFIGRADGKHPHHVLRVDEESVDLLTTDVQQQLAKQIQDRLKEFDAVLISDYAKGVCCTTAARQLIDTGRSVKRKSGNFDRNIDQGFRPQTTPAQNHFEHENTELILVKTVIRAANERNIPVLVDPGRGARDDCYDGATVLKPNRIEAELSTGFKIDSPKAAMRAGETLCKRHGLQAAVITLDRDGMVLSQKNSPGELFGALPRSVCDITGAGDMAFAMLGLVIGARHGDLRTAAGLREALPNAVRLANIASGMQVERFGVTPIRKCEIRAEILRTAGISREKLVELGEIQAIVERHRRNGKTIVFTNGCFDLLHVGHVTMLEESARLGDILVVAINSDQSVRRLKGKDRPIIRQQDRARLLASLECVHYVVTFDTSTPHQLLEAIRPDVLVKGGTTPEIVGREVVESYGGRVVRTNAIPNLSTTSLVARLGERTSQKISGKTKSGRKAMRRTPTSSHDSPPT